MTVTSGSSAAWRQKDNTTRDHGSRAQDTLYPKQILFLPTVLNLVLGQNQKSKETLVHLPLSGGCAK